MVWNCALKVNDLGKQIKERGLVDMERGEMADTPARQGPNSLSQGLSRKGDRSLQEEPKKEEEFCKAKLWLELSELRQAKSRLSAGDLSKTSHR